MNTFRLCNLGHFAGEFAITTDKVTYSIGDRIQVRQTGDMYQTAITVTNPRSGREMPVFALPVIVDFPCPEGAVEAELRSVPTLTFQHWLHCLSKENYVEVSPLKMSSGGFDWYVPVVDDWVISMHGRVTAPARAHERVRK